MVLAFGPGVPGSNPIQIISAMHLFVCFFVTDFVRKMGARPELPKSHLYHLTHFHTMTPFDASGKQTF